MKRIIALIALALALGGCAATNAEIQQGLHSVAYTVPTPEGTVTCIYTYEDGTDAGSISCDWAALHTGGGTAP